MMCSWTKVFPLIGEYPTLVSTRGFLISLIHNFAVFIRWYTFAFSKYGRIIRRKFPVAVSCFEFLRFGSNQYRRQHRECAQPLSTTIGSFTLTRFPVLCALSRCDRHEILRLQNTMSTGARANISSSDSMSKENRRRCSLQ